MIQNPALLSKIDKEFLSMSFSSFLGINYQNSTLDCDEEYFQDFLNKYKLEKKHKEKY